MSPARIVVHVQGRLRRRWMLRLGIWLARKCYVEVFADGKSLGRRTVIEVEYVEEAVE